MDDIKIVWRVDDSWCQMGGFVSLGEAKRSAARNSRDTAMLIVVNGKARFEYRNGELFREV